MARAVVFDFDGLILDTETSIFRAWCECYDRYGCDPIDDAWWATTIGSGERHDLIAPIRDRLGPDADYVEIDEWRRRRRDELLADEVVLAGVAEWIEDASRLGLSLGVASSSPPDWVEGHLRRMGLIDHFRVVRCFVDDGLAPKPAPDLYVAACDALGVPPTEAIAVEDSPNGVAAAKAAGMRCVTVPRGLTAGLDFSGADLVVRSLADVPLETALVRLGW